MTIINHGATYSGTIDSLFTNAAINGVLTLTHDDLSYFAPTIASAHSEGRIKCVSVEGGFQYRLCSRKT